MVTRRHIFWVGIGVIVFLAGFVPLALIYAEPAQHIFMSDRVIARLLGIQTLILGAAALFALMQVRVVGKTNRVKACFDTMSAEIADRDLVLMRDRWRQIRRVTKDRHLELNYENLLKLEGSLNKGTTTGDDPAVSRQIQEPHRSLVEYVIQICNYYEVIAVGTRNGAIDKTMYKEWWRTSLVLDWLDLRTFISDYRRIQNVDGAFREFERLACEWISDSELEGLPDADKRAIRQRCKAIRKAVERGGPHFRGFISSGKLLIASRA
jgi:hypothetical protein